MQHVYQTAHKHGISLPISLLQSTTLYHVFEWNGKRIPMYRIQHNNTFGPYKGGIRIHQTSTLEDVKLLAETMTLKNTLYRLPFGGGKGLIQYDAFATESDKTALITEYARAFQSNLGQDIDIPAPDIGTTARLMDIFNESIASNMPHKRWNCTGKTVPNGGCPGRREATGRGCVTILEEWAKSNNVTLRGLTFALQGYGNVGSVIARELCARGMRLVCVSDHKGSHTGFNLLPTQLECMMRDSGTIASHQDGLQWLRSGADVVIPAAIGDCIRLEDVSHLASTKVILEAANNGISSTIESRLSALYPHLQILPDILTNAGGVISSHAEYVQNVQNVQNQTISDREQQYRIRTTFRRIWNLHLQHSVSIREACFIDVATAFHNKYTANS